MRKGRWGLVLIAIAAVGTGAGGVVQDSSYRILVVNDDGIRSRGIQTLAEELREIADEVIVVAPAENRSGSSHATSSRVPLQVEEYRENGVLLGYAVSGFPADATRFGLLETAKDREIDLVVSGINRGANVGNVAHLSGTVGAAMEALYLGVPAIAVSAGAGVTDFRFAAQFTARFVSELRRRGVPDDVLLSINIPAATAEEIRGVVGARMGGAYLKTVGFDPQDGARPLTYMARTQRITEFEPGTDSHAYYDGLITITPLRFHWTDEAMLDELSTWGLTVQPTP